MRKSSFKARFAQFIAGLGGWKISVADDVPRKCVVIGAPHTSNWDGILMVLVGWKAGFSMRFLGKNSLFRFPLGIIMRYFGGIPVDRSHPHGLVGYLQQEFARAEEMRLAITPEGTRSWRPYWKSGFYNIAYGAGVPVALGYVDAATKTCGIAHHFYLSGNVEQDMAKIADFYADKVGIRPKLVGPVQLKNQSNS